MIKEIKEFSKICCYILMAYFIEHLVDYYIPVSWSAKGSWFGLTIFAFILFLGSKS